MGVTGRGSVVARLVVTIALYLVGYAILGEDLHSWPGVLVLVLLIWGAIELIVAPRHLASIGWAWKRFLHATAAFAAILVAVVIGESNRWFLVAAIYVAAAFAWSKLGPAVDGPRQS